MARLLAFALLILAAGCTSVPELYTWGEYEQQIYVAFTRPGEMPPERQAEGMEKDYQAARAANKRLPPGWHAHLGYVYFQLGRLDQAQQELLTEKAEFPESTVFVDRLMTNLKRQ